MALGYLSPCGKLVLKKYWQFSDDTIKKTTINNGSFVREFINLVVRENWNTKHLKLKIGRKYNRSYKVTPNTKKKLLNAMYMLIEIELEKSNFSDTKFKYGIGYKIGVPRKITVITM